MDRIEECRARVIAYETALMAEEPIGAADARLKLERWCFTDMKELLSEIDRLTAEKAGVERERNAILADLALEQCCELCKLGDVSPSELPCSICDGESKFEWRGVKEDGHG